ncbi:MAG: hypothetical protein HY966_00190, partial [Ignavibacteriales bacterium]|nr:hypothetical protein [Ignavibacteriales bacterium]
WPGQYGGRGGAYDFDGQQPAAQPASGYLWDVCKKFGVTYRSYGEFVRNGKTDRDSATSHLAGLKGHIAPFYRGWDLSCSDIDRVKAWQKEFDEYERNGNLPQCCIFTLPNDHTAGTGKNQLTPQAFVAQNDFALGLLVERISKSRYWKESAIFVLEDDAQNGPDHVDAHRSVGMVISPYTKRKFVDHTLYTTASMLRTMELFLGLPPMSQYDAAATPMASAFTLAVDTAGYTVEQPRYDLTRKNRDGAYGQLLMERMDFTTVDAAPDRLFNEIIWQSIKGTSMPAPKYSILSGVPRATEKQEEDDD